MNMTAVVDYREPDVQLDRTADADGERNFGGGANQTGTAGEYPGYDRFGRVVRHMWVDGDFQRYDPQESLHSDPNKPHIPPIYELTHTYDRASNRLTRINETSTLAWDHHDEAFEYDDLHRVTKAERGDGVDLHASSRTWTLDTLGNWDETATWGGSAFDEVETRDHSQANELTSRVEGASGPLDLTYDKAGNLRMQEVMLPGGGSRTSEVDYTYDAWNRLVTIEYDAITRAEYQYNGLNGHCLKAMPAFSSRHRE